MDAVTGLVVHAVVVAILFIVVNVDHEIKVWLAVPFLVHLLALPPIFVLHRGIRRAERGLPFFGRGFAGSPEHLGAPHDDSDADHEEHDHD